MEKAASQRKDYVCTVENQADIRFVQDALYVLSGKWRMPIVIVLHNGLRHYREIQKAIPGITFAMLSRELKLMTLNKLVVRIEDPDFPKQVEYQLTPYCRSFYPLVENLITWGKQHRELIRTSL